MSLVRIRPCRRFLCWVLLQLRPFLAIKNGHLIFLHNYLFFYPLFSHKQIIKIFQKNKTKIKTLLVTFQNNTDVIGLKYIHSYLCENQIDSHILFIPKYNESDAQSVMNFLEQFKPKIVGISLMSQEFYDANGFPLL